jgi:hypothetical protein
MYTKKRFTIRYPNGTELFSCDLKSTKCRAPHCEIMTNYPYGYCPLHLKEMLHLSINETKIKGLSGKGLFAEKVFKGPRKRKTSNDLAGEKIISYEGEELTEKEHLQRYKGNKGPYVMKIAENKYIDAACKRYPAAFINHPLRSKSNARFGTNGSVKTKRKINKGDEIVVNYSYRPSLEKDGYTFETV